jgi:hypothetical protein
MRPRLARLVVAGVLAWTWIYTLGMTKALRDSRRAEIESDVWESQFELSPFHMFLRLVLGMPDDLGWRLEQVAVAGIVGRRGLVFGGRVLGAAIFVCALGAIDLDASRRKPVVFVSSQSPSTAPARPTTPAERFIARLIQNRYAISVQDGRLSGAAAQVLQSAITKSRFILLGEYHGLIETPKFWTAVCNTAGAHVMAIEEGPLAAAALEASARRPDGAAQLAAFRKTFPESINIYSAREEFEMLQQCARAARNDFHLWGLNQENIGAAGLILTRVLASGVGTNARPAIEQLLKRNDEADRKVLQSGNLFDLFMFTADDAELSHAAELIEKDGSREARALFGSLLESREIFKASPANPVSARRRERLMKTLFAADYAGAGAVPPKVLLKFGALHGHRGLSPLGGSAIGNYVAEFAEGQGAESLHILLLAVKGAQPFYPTPGQPGQLRQFDLAEEPDFRYMQPMFGNLLPSDWTMFDLRPLRQNVGAPAASSNPAMSTLIFGYDIVVLVPESTPSTLSRQEAR